jgi:1-acylglycerone phosphate reductase
MPLIASTYDTNLLGVIRVTKAVAPHMIARRSGLIINVSSIAADMFVPPLAPLSLL